MPAVKSILLSRFAVRWYFALALVMATFNTTDYSFVGWAMRLDAVTDNMPLFLLAGAVLLIGYVIYIRAALESIGYLGVGLMLAFFAAMFWLLQDWGIFSVDSYDKAVWITILVTSLIMAAGMSASFVRRRVTGQQDVT